MVPELEEGELEKNVQPMVLEYFEHGDTREVMVRGGLRWGPQGRGPSGTEWGGGPLGTGIPVTLGDGEGSLGGR